MEFKFQRSLVIIGQLAQKAARTPPSEDQPPFEYIDQSLTILGRTFDTFDERIRQEFLAQQEVWTCPPEMPKHLMGLYLLGQHAKGIFEPNWKGTSSEKGDVMNDALNIIQKLAGFFNTAIPSDNASESESTEILVETSVDEHMDEILVHYGIVWEDVLERGMEHEKVRLPSAGVKRAGERSSKGGKKKSKG